MDIYFARSNDFKETWMTYVVYFGKKHRNGKERQDER